MEAKSKYKNISIVEHKMHYSNESVNKNIEAKGEVCKDRPLDDVPTIEEFILYILQRLNSED